MNLPAFCAASALFCEATANSSCCWRVICHCFATFSAVVPICGRGAVASAASLKALPTWFVTGDEDRVETVRNGREMIEARNPTTGHALNIHLDEIDAIEAVS